MRISKKAEYAMRAVVAVAKAPGGQPLPLAELAQAEEIPQRFLEQIVIVLRRGGILESRRGASGGYLLAKPASSVTLAELLELVDGPVRLLESGAGGGGTDSSGLSEVFSELETSLVASLGETTVDDVLARDARRRESMAFEI